MFVTIHHMNVNDEVKAIADYIALHFHPTKIILFGSMADGNIREGSDIDLLIVKDGSGGRIRRTQELYQLLWKRGRYPIGVDMIVMTPKELSARLTLGDPFYKDVIASGQTLYQTS